MIHFRHPARLRLTIWLACFAILVSALAPTISRVLASARSDIFSSDLCITRPAGFALKAAAPDAGMNDSMDHCAYCLQHGGNAPVPAIQDGLGLAGQSGLRPFLFYRAPKPLLALTAAAPRGPPVLA